MEASEYPRRRDCVRRCSLTPRGMERAECWLGMCSWAGAHHSLRVLVLNQQVLEFRGAAAAIKSVVRRRLPWATLHLDNQGVLWGLRTGKVGVGLREQRRCVRQVMYALAREGTSVHLSYVPGTDMPADYLFRVCTRFFGDVGMALGPPWTIWRMCCRPALSRRVGASCGSDVRPMGRCGGAAPVFGRVTVVGGGGPRVLWCW